VGIEQNLAATIHGEESRNRMAAIDLLTPTQLKVLRGVHLGLLNKQIAYDLGITEATVKAHMTALMRKLNVHNRTQAAMAVNAIGRVIKTDPNNSPSLAH
jgi:DNA-binding NarL/FixJ family response regulator